MTDSAATGWAGMNTGPDPRANGARSCKRSWTGWEIGAMVAGFVVFWPVGLVALGVKLVKGEMWPGSSRGVKPWELFSKREGGMQTDSKWNFSSPFGAKPASHTGNFAFEDYKKRELERLDAERRRLMEEQKAFSEFVEHVRRAKDQEEFDRFMADRRGVQS